MARPQDFNVASMADLGNKWFTCLDTPSPVATAAWAGLNKRGYSPDPKAKGPGLDHHAEGKALFKAMTDSDLARAGAKPARATSAQTETNESKSLRLWVRGLHRDITAIAKQTKDPALGSLAAMGDVNGQPGLKTAVDNMLGLLGNPDALKALAPFNITADDAKAGQVLVTAWNKSRSTTAVARGGEAGQTTDNIQARQAFVEWLSMWWKIAKTHLKDQPDVLTALGVVTASVKRAKAKAAGTIGGQTVESGDPSKA